MKSKAERAAHRDFKRMLRTEEALTKSVLEYADACGMDIRRFEPEISQRSRDSLRITFGCSPTPESQEVLRQLWQNIERHALFPQQQDFVFSGPSEHASLREPQIHIALTRYGPEAYGETIDRNATSELTERFRNAAREQRQNPVAEFKHTGETHLYRSRNGVHTHKDLALFDAVEGLARAFGMPRQDDNGSAKMHCVVKDRTTLRVEFHGENPNIDTQAASFKSILKEEARIKPDTMEDKGWMVPKQKKNVMFGDIDFDYYGHRIDIDIAANGGFERLTQKIAHAAQAQQGSHVDRLASRAAQSTARGFGIS